MTVTEQWTTNLKNGIFRGLTPILDLFEPAYFYIGDGWGSAFPSMKVRKLSLETGKEMASAYIKNTIRCLHFSQNKEEIFVVSDSKIFQINRARFTIENKFAKGIQRYNDYINSNEKDTLLLMNYNSDYLFVYNYISGKSIKKKIKTCRGIVKDTENSFLIFSANNGAVVKYDLTENTTAEVLKTVPYCNIRITKSGALYFHCGRIKEATEIAPELVEPLPQLKIYTSIHDTAPVSIDFNFSFDSFLVAENEDVIYLSNENTIWAYSLKDKSIINKFIFDPKARIAQIFEKQKRILTYKMHEEKSLTCWSFQL